ncbi:HEAT repeat protein [Aspergillus sp. HF37]|nr:HEAT repeat protein [Aspergillus sp. HF37]
MDNRQESFKTLRAPCVELSSISLRFRGHQAAANDVLRALEPVHAVLTELGDKDALDEKLAEYSFFPLSHIFNETQRVSARCLELAVNCLRALVTKGWRQRLSPQMGKQLIILLTLIVGGTPNQAQGQTSKSQPEELVIAGFDCLSSIFSVLQGPEAERTIFHEVGTATIVDQTVYILLEGIVDDRSDDLCLAAARALQTLYLRITDRVVLASMMPRTVSALTKVLKPTTQKRRSYQLLVVCLQILTQLLKTVLNDRAASAPDKSQANERIALDDSWLKATTTQIKLALSNVIQVRRHERLEMQDAVLGLCLMVIEDCQNTLQESLPIMVETVVVLSDLDEQHMPNSAYSTLKHLAITYPAVLDSLKDSLHGWITSFPRTMKGNDETAKQWGIRQISTVFQVLSQVQSGSDILTSSLASGLCDSVAAAVSHSSLQPLNLPTTELSLDVINQNAKSVSFPPVLLEHRSQQQTLQDLQSMVVRLNASDSGAEITRSIINQMHNTSEISIISPFWLALTFLKNDSLSMDDFISFGQDELSLSSKASMVEELYCISLPVLNEPDTMDWRVSALALEAIALQAQQLGEAFRPELMDALYPTLQFLASGNPGLQRHAMACLNILAESCSYTDVSAMIIDNVDYLVNSVGLKLNTFDVSPYPPQVMLMMVKLCGAHLIPYLDDLIEAIFGVLNLYHGYPKLVELMFRTLAAIVEEGTKGSPLLAITNADKPVDHRKRQYQRLQMSTLIEDIAARAKRAKDKDEDERIPHPKRPWGESEQPEPETESFSELLEKEESEDDPLPPPKEPEDSEKPLSKPHTLLLHIVKSIPSHLSSPSPYLRRSLLSILNQVLPTLAHNENSFLPLINDLWPSVASKITFPASFTESSSTSLTTTDTPRRADDFSFQEEIYVITSACQAIETMCTSAGDFMASRIESEYPRWERLYRRAWERVRQDAEKAMQRRQYAGGSPSHSVIPALSLALSSASAPGTRSFTPHHTLWRA